MKSHCIFYFSISLFLYLFHITSEQYTISNFKRQDSGNYTCVFDGITHTMQVKG